LFHAANECTFKLFLKLILLCTSLCTRTCKHVPPCASQSQLEIISFWSYSVQNNYYINRTLQVHVFGWISCYHSHNSWCMCYRCSCLESLSACSWLWLVLLRAIGTQIMFTDALLGSVKTDHALTYCKKLLCTRRACNFFKGIRRLSYFCIPVIIVMFVFPIILHLQDLQSAQFNSHLSTCSSVTFFWYFPGDPQNI